MSEEIVCSYKCRGVNFEQTFLKLFWDQNVCVTYTTFISQLYTSTVSFTLGEISDTTENYIKQKKDIYFHIKEKELLVHLTIEQTWWLI